MKGTCPNSVPRLSKPLNNFPSITTAPPMPVPTVTKTTWLKPFPAPYIVSPIPIMFALFATVTKSLVLSSIKSANGIFSHPLMFSAPPNTIRSVLSMIPGVPIPTPTISLLFVLANAFTSSIALSNCETTASFDISPFDGIVFQNEHSLVRPPKHT